MGLLFIYLILALAFSFMCSVLEAVILSVTMSFIQTRIMEGKKSARLLKRLKSNIDQPLAAILTINTIAHTVGAAGVGAQAVKVFGDVYFGIISAVLTFLILIFSEIIPKTIGARHWRKLALASSHVLIIMIYISYPLVWLSKRITNLVIGKKRPNSISRDEMAALVHLGHKEGIFEESEQKIINNLLKFRFIKVNRIMTPRTVLVAAPESLTLQDFFNNKEFLRYSRIPIYSKKIDNITGYVLKYDVLEKLAKDQFSLKLNAIKREILVCYENLTIPAVFEKLLEKREHITLIVDEYGSVAGIATLEDIFETLLGLEIIDETDSQVDMQQLARKKWLLRLQQMESSQKGGDLLKEDRET
ncbi:MAG: HlyC/CorC family transporter [Bacteroidales bacterium]|nr:HlyC/CorC family transporter [Bacteroidales bacterium]